MILNVWPRHVPQCPFAFSVLESPTPAILVNVLQAAGPSLMVHEHHAAEYMIEALKFIDFLIPDSLQEIKVAGVLVATVHYTTREIWIADPPPPRKKK